MRPMRPSPRVAAALLALIYAVGVVGLSTSLRPLFVPLTPINLLLTLSVLLAYHGRWERDFVLFAFTVVLGGFAVEWLGVHTGVPFGAYEYLDALGPKLDGVSLVIGVNWLILIYSIGVLVQGLSRRMGVRVLLGALLMVAIDLLIEPVAIRLGFWAWRGGSIPVQNYLGWLVVSAAFLWLFERLRFRKDNPMGLPVFAICLAFFALLGLPFLSA